jgi:uncharacterized BrkB/YihY/UPF0761 family membrane protein
VNRLRRNIWISLVLGILSLFSMVICVMALQDVFHGESDLSLEWQIVRLGFSIIFIFNVFVLITLIRLLRGER